MIWTVVFAVNYPDGLVSYNFIIRSELSSFRDCSV